jgi:aminoglycoside phosphotransferase (APT) family kinase protein
MTGVKMHADEVDIDASLVRRLLAEQFPQWARLPVEPVPSSGTDNALFRLGEELAVRLPRLARTTGQVEKDLRWLPRLAPYLPLAVPAPVASGVPGVGYAWTWGVYRWLEGEEARLDRLADPEEAAGELADFIRTLQAVDTAGGPEPRRRGSGRGVALSMRDEYTREAIAALALLGEIDAEAATAAWEESVAAPVWGGEPVWIHGDLLPGNLLVTDGRFTAVIDFACLGVGDPAGDLLPAWSLFSGGSREAFRTALGMDDATWLRGRGWALSIALIQLPYYLETNPEIVAGSRYVIAEVLADHARTAATPAATPTAAAAVTPTVTPSAAASRQHS